MPTAPTDTLPSCFLGDFTISTEEGVQQGDPLGPLLFCLAIHDNVNLKSCFNVFYLDDGTLGGSVSDVKADIANLEAAAREINLFLNHDKSKIICVDELFKSSMLSSSPSLVRWTLPKHPPRHTHWWGQIPKYRLGVQGGAATDTGQPPT